MQIIFTLLKANPRFLTAIFLGTMAFMLFGSFGIERASTKAILSWDVAVLFYSFVVAIMMVNSNHEKITARARMQAEGKGFVLFVACVATIVSMLAIVIELSLSKSVHGWLKWEHVSLAGVTIFLSWIFIHTIFCLYYAHTYYQNICAGKPGGLMFPGKEMPDYFDFMYFSFVIATSGQTADVSIANSKLRRVGTLHCIISYVFNTTVLALTINIASSLL